MDGCRKAPIMTIGINPNLTAFAPGKTGASWCYPSFSSADNTDSWTKYAYYYRYRSVYQEHFDLNFIESYLLPDGSIRAAKPGLLLRSSRTSDDPSYEILVQYDGDPGPTAVHLPGKFGQPRYVVLVDANTRFKKDDLLAARLQVPGGQKTDVYAQPIGYYMQMVPVLSAFEAFLKEKGHPNAHLQIGEDVGQLDMVAWRRRGGGRNGSGEPVRACTRLFPTAFTRTPGPSSNWCKPDRRSCFWSGKPPGKCSANLSAI